MSTPRILAIAGSARKDSLNLKALRVAAAAASGAGAEVTIFDWSQFDIPMYDGDLEAAEGIPADVAKAKELFNQHDGLLIASPEYNSSIAPILKNLIDWVSRPAEGEAPLAAFNGKVATLLAASPGGLGGLRGLVTVRSILGNIKVIVLPDQFAMGAAHTKFDDQGNCTDDRDRAMLESLGTGLANYLS